MDGQQNLEAIMGLIMYGGSAKSSVMKTIAAAKSGDFGSTDKKIADTEESLMHARHSQTGMLAGEAKGNDMQVILLTAHSQDHLVTATTFTDLAKKIIDLYRRIDNE